jgi:hypothetical protein
MGCGGSKGASEEQLVEIRAKALGEAREAIAATEKAESADATLGRAEATLAEALTKSQATKKGKERDALRDEAQKRLKAIDASITGLRETLRLDCVTTKEMAVLQAQVAELKTQLADAKAPKKEASNDSAHMGAKPDILKPACETRQFKSSKAQENAKLYTEILKGHEGAVATVFKKVDTSGDGALQLNELKEIVTVFSGEQFDEKVFLDYWDVMGAADGDGDASLDEVELGWYLADSAEENGKMPQTIDSFLEAVDYIHQKNTAA